MKETRSFPDNKIVDPSLLVSSLHLLVPPLQLFSAAMWQVLQQQHVFHYGKLEEFVSLVMEMSPELLSESQWTELTLGLQHMDPAQIGCKTDPALEVLLWEFLSRLDQLLLVPDLKQTVSWLCAAPSVLEVCVQSFTYIDQLRTLLRSHRSCQRLDKNETLPSLEECKLSDMGLPPSQQVVDSAKLTKTNSQSQSITDCMNALNPTSSGEDMKAESVMDSSDCTGAGPQSSLNRCENVEERTQRKTGNLMSRKQNDIPANMKEEEDWESQSLEMKREDDESYEEGYRKEKEKQTDKRMEGNATGRATQTDELVQNIFSSNNGQQEGVELFTLVTSCLLKQPRVLIRKLESGSRSVRSVDHVSSTPDFMVTPLRANGSLSLKKDQSLTQKRKTIDQLERALKLLPSSSEIRMCPEVSHSSSVVSCREQNTGRAVEELSQGVTCSQYPFVHPEEVNLHQHIEKVHTEELNRTLGSQPPPCSTHECPTPPKTPPIPTPSHTDSPGAHTCSQCGKSFRRLSYFKVHVQTHTGEWPYQCSQCGKSFLQSCNLKVHQRTHTGERPYPCSQCGNSFSQLYLLKRHQLTHTGESPYPCSQCGKSFKTLSYFKAHMRTHTGEWPYHCSQCGKRFLQLCNLKVHQRSHTGERPYPCSQCGKSFMRLSHLKSHLLTHTGEWAYPCSQCGKSFRTLSNFKVHVRTHIGERPYACAQCGKSFLHSCDLKVHQQTHTRDRPYPCSQCGKSFTRLSHLKDHLQTHTGERPYPCSQCEKSFMRLGHLKDHLQTHTGQRAYPCSHCGKSFRTLSYLKAHQRTHTGERPYPCSQCGKSFMRLGHLKDHLQTHTGEWAYLCSQCGKSFRKLSYLKVHQRTHTGECPYPCSQCGKSFSRLSSLKIHQQTHTE